MSLVFVVGLFGLSPRINAGRGAGRHIKLGRRGEFRAAHARRRRPLVVAGYEDGRTRAPIARAQGALA
jgi:hypothetical protein